MRVRESIVRLMERLNIGKLKTLGERLKMYLGWGQFLMLTYVFLAQQPSSQAMMVIGVTLVISVFMVIMDTIFIMPQEQKYTWEKTASFMEYKKELMQKFDEVEKLAKACMLREHSGQKEQSETRTQYPEKKGRRKE
ncbi:MAG: hypothetical protein JW834_01280 [Candidatus Diapherotrites archaeon]|nr:hypothetical protein [Candidatus Diapherotrites archaeon]